MCIRSKCGSGILGLRDFEIEELLEEVTIVSILKHGQINIFYETINIVSKGGQDES